MGKKRPTGVIIFCILNFLCGIYSSIFLYIAYRWSIRKPSGTGMGIHFDYNIYHGAMSLIAPFVLWLVAVVLLFRLNKWGYKIPIIFLTCYLIYYLIWIITTPFDLLMRFVLFCGFPSILLISHLTYFTRPKIKELFKS